MKIIVLYIPVIHKGYLGFLEKIRKKVSKIYIISKDLEKELSDIKSDITSLDEKTVKELLENFGFKEVSILSKKNIGKIKGKKIVLLESEISRKLKDKYLKEEKIEWESAFLRWDKEDVLNEVPLDVKKSKDSFDSEMMEKACGEAKKSGDWWRQVGAVLVKEKKIILSSYNQGVPNDNYPYQLGSVRDFFKAGDRQEISPTVHAEQKIISEAARKGIKIEGTSLYITHFPCSLCAKLIACSGIKNLYFQEGASTLEGKKILELSKIKIIQII